MWLPVHAGWAHYRACDGLGFEIPYFRNAIRGLWQVAVEFFCTKAYVTETGRREDSYHARIAWV